MLPKKLLLSNNIKKLFIGINEVKLVLELVNQVVIILIINVLYTKSQILKKNHSYCLCKRVASLKDIYYIRFYYMAERKK